MQAVFAEAEQLLVQGEPFVLATVVRTKGSTPQKPGAKLLVRGDGSIVGTLGGGCVEAEIWAAAKLVLEKGGEREVRRFTLDEDMAAKDGLVCGGTMDILVDRIAAAKPELLPLVREILGAYEGKGDRALATLLSPGATGGDRWAKLFIRADGSAAGTLGSKALDAVAEKIALENMSRGIERWVETEDGAEVFVEAFTTPATLVIAGGGHVGKALYTIGSFLGFRTVVVDDRPQFASRERFPAADRIIVDDFDRGLESFEMGPNHYVVVATRGHKQDDVALLAAARSGAGYIGLLGSRRKAVMIFRDLIRKGVPEERIRDIRSPVGLDLGGRQPEEIAASILAEIVAVKYGRSGSPMSLAGAVVAQAERLASRPGARGV